MFVCAAAGHPNLTVCTAHTCPQPTRNKSQQLTAPRPNHEKGRESCSKGPDWKSKLKSLGTDGNSLLSYSTFGWHPPVSHGCRKFPVPLTSKDFSSWTPQQRHSSHSFQIINASLQNRRVASVSPTCSSRCLSCRLCLLSLEINQ